MQHSHTNHIFLNASAGSGKTFALCVRYIALLFKNVQANEILTLTFTKKAANEMKERITYNLFILYTTQINNNEVSQYHNRDKEYYKNLLMARDEIIKALKEYDVDEEFVKKNISKVYRHFLQANKKISTIDSFFHTILRKFAFFVGIRRDFKLQEKELYNQIFEVFLISIYKNPKLYKIIHSLTRDLKLHIETQFNNTLTLKELMYILYDKSIEFATKKGFSIAMQPTHTLKRAIDFTTLLIKQEENIDNFNMTIESKNNDCIKPNLNIKSNVENPTQQDGNKIESYRDIFCYLHNIITNKDLQPNPEYIVNHIMKSVHELINLLYSIAPKGEIKGRVKDFCKKLSCGDIESILKNKLIVNKKHQYITTDLKPNQFAEYEIAKLCTKIQNLGILYFMCKESAILAHIYLLMEVYTQTLQIMENQQNIFSFQSITHKVFAITTDTLYNDLEFQSDYFYFRLDSAISHILFDEYQDTSIIQYRIFLPLFQEILSGSGTKDSKSLFFVGDSKQSLYAFRGANSCVFDITKDLESIQHKSLQHNYRSKKAIIDFVNEKFSSIYKTDYIQQLYGKDSKDIEGIVSIRLYGSHDTKGNKEEQQEVMQDIFEKTLQQINELIQSGIPKKDIAILARKRETLHAFARFAKEKKSNLLFNLDKNGKLINQKSIQAIFYAFKTHEYKYQIKLLESTLANLQEKEQDTKKEILQNKSSDINSIQETIKTLLNNYKFAQKKLNKLLGKSYFNNQNVYIPKTKSLAHSIKIIIESFCLYNQDCMELLEIASENIEIKTIDKLFEFIADKDSIVMQEEAIHAMSVHGSKGLGFQYVIYIDYEKQSDGSANKIFYDYKDIFLKDIRIDTTKSDTKQYRDNTIKTLIESKIQDDIQQEYNNLYVACTRAKNGLYIFAHTQSTIAQTLQLQPQEEYGIFVPPSIQHTKDCKINPIIISELQVKKTKQEEFLHDETKNMYQNNIAMQNKQMMGLGIHYCLELMLGYGVQQPTEMLHSNYGFYLKSDCIVEILQKAQNIYSSKIKKLLCLDKNMIKCEVSFLQENSIKRLDAIVQHSNGFSIIEFKSSQNISEALLQSHTAQLQSYMECIATIFKNTKQIQGYLVYLQDEVAVKEIILHKS